MRAIVITALLIAFIVFLVKMHIPIIFNILLVVVASSVVGVMAAGPSRAQRDSDNLAQIAQIERNRYFRKQD